MGKRLRHQRRGRGGSVYRSPGHRHHGRITGVPPGSPPMTGRVVSLEHDPGRTAPVAHVRTGSGQDIRTIAPAGISVGAEVNLQAGDPTLGSILPIGSIPEGTRVCNIEIRPGSGGKLVRSAGTSALIVMQKGLTKVQLPSGSYRDLDPSCRATVGVAGASGRPEKPFGKAGKKYHAYRSRGKAHLHVKGVAMNPVSHPHGGGSHHHVGKPSTVKRGAWPGRKVGRLSPKKRRRRTAAPSRTAAAAMPEEGAASGE